MTRDEAEKISHELVQKGMAEADAYIAAARTMLAALIAVANDPDTPADLRGMAFAVIAQAEAAGIKAEAED